MPRKVLPPGWPDPYDLLRDVNYEENYPKILLRGIWNVMARNEVGGDLEQRYIAGFNFAVTRLVKAKRPRLFPQMVRDGIATKAALTTKGEEREAEVIGLRDLSKESIKNYGKKTRTEMEMNTKRKLIQLARWVDMIRATTTEEGMPSARVIERGGNVGG